MSHHVRFVRVDSIFWLGTHDFVFLRLGDRSGEKVSAEERFGGERSSDTDDCLSEQEKQEQVSESSRRSATRRDRAEEIPTVARLSGDGALHWPLRSETSGNCEFRGLESGSWRKGSRRNESQRRGRTNAKGRKKGTNEFDPRTQ